MSLAPTGEETESSNPPVQKSYKRVKEGGGWQGRPEWYEVNQGAHQMYQLPCDVMRTSFKLAVLDSTSPLTRVALISCIKKAYG